MINIREKKLYKLIFDVFEFILIEALEEGFKTNQLVNVSGLRRVGKTNALIKFAKLKDFPVIVNGTAEALSKEYDYHKVFSYKNYDESNVSVLVDEGINPSLLVSRGVNVITGYKS